MVGILAAEGHGAILRMSHSDSNGDAALLQRLPSPIVPPPLPSTSSSCPNSTDSAPHAPPPYHTPSRSHRPLSLSQCSANTFSFSAVIFFLFNTLCPPVNNFLSLPSDVFPLCSPSSLRAFMQCNFALCVQVHSFSHTLSDIPPFSTYAIIFTLHNAQHLFSPSSDAVTFSLNPLLFLL